MKKQLSMLRLDRETVYALTDSSLRLGIGGSATINCTKFGAICPSQTCICNTVGCTTTGQM